MADFWAQFQEAGKTPAELEKAVNPFDQFKALPQRDDLITDAPPPVTAGELEDMAKSFGSGVATGVVGTPAIAGNLEMMQRQIMDYMLSKVGRPGFAKAMGEFDEK